MGCFVGGDRRGYYIYFRCLRFCLVVFVVLGSVRGVVRGRERRGR